MKTKTEYYKVRNRHYSQKHLNCDTHKAQNSGHPLWSEISSPIRCGREAESHNENLALGAAHLYLPSLLLFLINNRSICWQKVGYILCFDISKIKPQTKLLALKQTAWRGSLRISWRSFSQIIVGTSDLMVAFYPCTAIGAHHTGYFLKEVRVCFHKQAHYTCTCKEY